MITLARRFHRDSRGLALIEFAVVVPLLLILYLGGYQLSDGIACNRKVTITARAAADLVSRSSTTTIAAADVDTALNASVQIMYPYSASAALVRVSQIATDASGNSTVTWSRAINGSGRVKNSPFPVPATIKKNGTSLLYSEVVYTYTPPVAFLKIVGPPSFTQNVYMSPRAFPSLTCQDCP